MGYQLFSDMTADVSEALMRGMPEVAYVPMQVELGGESFTYGPGGSLTVEQFYAEQRAGKFASTSQINPMIYRRCFEQALKAGEDVLYLCFSSGMSGTLQSANLCAEELREEYPARRLIVLENTGFLKNATPELAEYLKNMPETTYMIFVESELDKRGKLYKVIKEKGHIVELKRQDEKTLMRWAAGILAREGRKITTRDMELFLTKTGTDMGNIRMELEKLITYTMGQDIVTREDIEEICTTRTENKIFDMVRAVTERNQRRALDLYNDLLTLREPPMRILFLLSKQFRQMCLAKKMAGEGASQNEIATRLGVPSFVARNILACARAYSVEELEQAEEDFVDAEEAVKTGRLQDVLSVELLIVKYSTERKR